MKNRRIGKFRISRDLIEDSPQAVRELMGRCIVIQAMYSFAIDDVEYIALCDDFDEIDEGDFPLEYIALWRKYDDGPVTFGEWIKR